MRVIWGIALCALIYLVVPPLVAIFFGTPTVEELRGTARGIMELINEDRINQDIPPLQWDSELEIVAIAHSQYMAVTGNYVHSGNGLAENIAKGMKNAYEQWKRSPAHYLNYMQISLHRGAIGLAYQIKYWELGHIKIPVNISEYATFVAK